MHIHNPPVRNEHAQAVLLITARLAEEGFTIITSNTDDKADPQIFAQTNEMQFAFYFIRANPESEPAADTLARWRELAAHHQVNSFYIPVNLNSGESAIIPLKHSTL